MAKLIRTTIYLPEDLHAKLKIMAYARHLTMTKYVEQVLDKSWKEDEHISDRPHFKSLIDQLIKKNPQAWADGELRNL